MTARHRNRLFRKGEIKRIVTPEIATKILQWQQALSDDEMNHALIDDCLEVLANANMPKVDMAEKARVLQTLIEGLGIDPSEVSITIQKKRPVIDNQGKGRQPVIASLVALCALLLTAGIALATGILPWQLSIDTSNGFFEIRIVSSAKHEDNEQKMSNTALPTQFVESLKERDMAVALPQFWPDGYKDWSVEASEIAEPISYVACHFQKGEVYLNISVESILAEQLMHDDFTQTYEMSGHEVRTYRSERRTFEIYTNNDFTNVIWRDGDFILSITGNIGEEEAIRIIDTIN